MSQNLLHFCIYFSTGQFAQRLLADSDVPNYVCRSRVESVTVIVVLLLLRFYCAGQRSTPHYRTLEVRPGRIKLELKYDYDCERDDTNSLLGVLMFGWDVVIVNNE